jgi:hypothetical protein
MKPFSTVILSKHYHHRPEHPNQKFPWGYGDDFKIDMVPPVLRNLGNNSSVHRYSCIYSQVEFFRYKRNAFGLMYTSLQSNTLFLTISTH